jgi:hypothetical protein
MRTIAFIVESLSERGGKPAAAGRCAEDAIHAGDEFQRVVRYARAETLADFGEPPSAVEERPASVRVTGIRTYRRDVQVLDHGMTGELLLDTVSMPPMEPGDVLEGECP